MWTWLDKMGDAWKSFYDHVASIGGTAETAADPKVLQSGLQFGHVGFHNYTPELREEAAKQAGTILSLPVNATMRGITTALINNPGAGGDPLSTDHWSRAWGLTGEHTVSGQKVEGISLGQTLTNAFGVGPESLGLQDGLVDTPEAAAERYKEFHDTWAGQISSGTVDFLGNVFLDPTVIVGKFGKAAKLARATIAEQDISRVVAASAGDIGPLSGAAGRRVKDFNEILTWTSGKSAAEIYTHPAFKANSQGGTLAYLMSEADKLEYGQDVKRTLLGAALGDDLSIQSLKQNQALLANDLYRLSSVPNSSKATELFDHATGNSRNLMKANMTTAVEISAKHGDIEREMERLRRVIDGAGSSNVLRGTTEQLTRRDFELGQLRGSTIYSGLGNRPIHIVAGGFRSQLPGHVNLRDPAVGYDQLNRTLKQAPYLTGTDRQVLLNKFLKAATDGDRAGVVREAEARILRSTAAHYNVNPKDILTLAQQGETRRNAWTSLLKSRLYSADPKAAYVPLEDPEEDVLYAISRPLLRSQIEEHIPIIDPTAVDKSLRSATNRRVLERAAQYLGNKPLGRFGNLVPAVGDVSDFYRHLDGTGDLVSAGLQSMTKLWKDSMLIPRALAYGARVQVDSQMRLMTHLGFAGYVRQMRSALPAQLRYNRAMADLKFADAISDGDAVALKKALDPWLKKLGFEEGEFDQIVRMVKSENGAHAALVGELSNAAIQKMRANGHWGSVRGADPNWETSYLRAVNQQIRNSPVAMKAMEPGITVNDLRRFVRTDPTARKEWLEISGTQGNDLDGWLERIQAHVNHYLPDNEMRIALLKGPINDKHLADWFADVERKMDVHGESYSPWGGHPIAEFYNSARQVAYSAIADGPETILARMPLYLETYARNVRAMESRLVAGGGTLDQATTMTIRREADRMARREIKQVLFDTSDMSNLAHTMRFVAPFFAAWEDMIKKWGRLFYNNPAALERFRQVWNIPEAAGLATDENGNLINMSGDHIDPNTGKVVTDPALIGERDMIRVPLSWVPKSLLDAVGIAPDNSGKVPEIRIDKKSFNVVFQGDPWWLPGFGPLVEIPANALVLHAFPEAADNPVVKALLPFGVSNENPIQQMLPAWARYAATANRVPVFGDENQWRQQAGIVMREEWIKYQQGLRTDPTQDVGEIANKVKNYFVLRAALGLTAPVTVKPSQGMQFYIDQAHLYQQKYGNVQQSPEYIATLREYQNKYGGTEGKSRMLAEHPEFQDALTRFRHDFPQYFDLAISISTNNTGIVASEKAVISARKMQKIISQAPEFGWMFVGPDNAYGFSEAAHTWEVGTEVQPGLTYRSYQSPIEALAKAEVQNGWGRYSAARTKLNMALESRGLHSLNQKGAEDLKEAWDAWVDRLAAYNTYWGHDYLNTSDSTAVDALNAGLKAMASDKNLAQRQDMVALQRYAVARTQVMELLAQRGSGGLGNKANEDIEAAWNAYVQKLVQWSPGFEQIYNRVLLKDQLNVPLSAAYSKE